MYKKVAVIAEELEVSPQYIYQLIRDPMHLQELQDHISHEGKRQATVLDDYAQDYLAKIVKANKPDEYEIMTSSPEYLDLQRKYFELLESYQKLGNEAISLQKQLLEGERVQLRLEAANDKKDRDISDKDRRLEEQSKQLEAKEQELEATKCQIAGAQMDARNAQEHEQHMKEERDAAVSALGAKDEEIRKLQEQVDRPLSFMERLTGRRK